MRSSPGSFKAAKGKGAPRLRPARGPFTKPEISGFRRDYMAFSSTALVKAMTAGVPVNRMAWKVVK